MKATITQTGDFVREAEITRVTALAESYHLAFSSYLSTAKDPQSVQRNFGLILNREELQVLRDLLDEALKHQHSVIGTPVDLIKRQTVMRSENER